MCGITGYVSSKNWDSKKMLDSMHHRGPDNTGEYHTTVNEKNVFLGHKRLSIIDTSPDGNQPMGTEDQSVLISYNGEIYNFESLKNKFLSEVKFKSATDTEVVLKLYEKKGLSFLQELNGDFSISILDKKQNKLYLIRDKMGVKPLYYFHDKQSLIFASEIKSILAAGIPASLSENRLREFFTFKYVPENNTLFENVYRVPAGHILCYDITTNTIDINEYWKPKAQSKYDGISYDEAKKEAYSLTQDACNIRLMSDVPVGSFFSGGLDSSIIAHFLKNTAGINYYTAGKEKKDLLKEGTTSDIHYAKKLAQDWSISLNEITIGGSQLTKELIQKTLRYSDDLIADGSQIPTFLITEQATKSSTVILSGMGADELFLGYAGHQLLYLDQKAHAVLPDVLTKSLLKRMAKLNPGVGSFKAYKRYLKKFGLYEKYGNARFALYNIVGDYESSANIFKKKSAPAETEILDLLGSYFPADTDPFESLKNFERSNFLIKNLHYTDRMCMANSMENRVPFLDERMVEFAYSLPTSYKLGAFGKTKRILKDTFSPHLPSYVIQRRKAGFGMPLRSLLSDATQLQHLLDLDFFNNFEYFDLEGIQLVIDQHMQGTKDNSALIYALITFQEWYKMYIG